MQKALVVRATEEAESARWKHYRKIIADPFSKAGFTWGCISTVDRKGRTTDILAPRPNALNHDCRVTGKHERVRSRCDLALVIPGRS
jgi:hypothetical protein